MSYRKIRWGILATGFIAHQFAGDLALCENSELIAVASRSKEGADKFAKKFNVERVYHSYEELAASDEVDVIYIATPHHLHYPNAKMCMEQGKHVLVEKPMTLNAHLTENLIHIAKKHDVFLMEAMWTRFIPAVKAAMEVVTSGEIGTPNLIESDFGFKAEPDPLSRLFNADFGGGSLLDVGIYPLALSFFFMGEPDSFVAEMNIGPTHVDEQCSITLKYRKAEAKLFSSIVEDTEREFSIHGDKGSLEFVGPMYAPTGFRVTMKNGESYVKDFSFKGNGYQFEAMEVETAIQNKEKINREIDGAFSLKISTLMDGIKAEATTVDKIAFKDELSLKASVI